jgi:tetratricopeptide (TPR) repeat protein
MGYCYAQQGKFAKAVKFESQALAGATDDDPEGKYELYWDLGWNCFMADQYAQALQYTDQAIEMKEHPDLILVLNRGLILLALGKAGEAHAAYGQAMDRADELENDEVLDEARHDLEAFLIRKHLEVDGDSAMASLLEGDLDIP